MKKSFGKFLTLLSAAAVLLPAMQFTAFASETDTAATPTPAAITDTAQVTPAAYGIEVALYLMESNNDWSYGDIDPTEWSEPKSESVYITEDGTYTLSLTDLDIPSENFMLCYLKDVAAYPKDTEVTHSNVPDDLMVITDVFKVNGSVKTVNDKVRTGLKKGIFDIAYHNNWDENDNCVDFLQTVNSVEITFTVTGITGEPGAIKYEPTQAPTPTVAAAANITDTAAAPASTAEEDSASGNRTGLIIGIVIAVIAVAAIIVIFLTRKKK